MSYRILLTCAGGGLAPEAIRLLRTASRHGENFVVAVDSSPNAIGRHFANAFELVPDGKDIRYAEVIGDIARRYQIDLVIPWSDDEALSAARGRALIEIGGRQLACAKATILETLADKTATYAVLESAGLPVPLWKRVIDVNDLCLTVDSLINQDRDVVVKPAISRGGRDVCVISRGSDSARSYSGGREMHMGIDTFKREYLSGYQNLFPVMVMEKLLEPTFDLDMLSRDGELIRAVVRRRVNPAVPNEGHIIEDNHEIYQLAPRIVSAFGLSWLYDCDIMLNTNGQPRILEINPRPSGSAAVAVAAGIPLFDDLISLAKGEKIPDIATPFGHKVVPYTSLVRHK